VRDLLAKALPTQPTTIFCVARDAASLAAIVTSRVDDRGEVVPVELEGSGSLDGLEDESAGTVVLGDVLHDIHEPDLLNLIQGCHRVLQDGGRLLLTDQLMPFDRMAPFTGRTFLRWIGVRYTSDEIFGLLERSGFWDCLVLRRGQFAADVVIRGEKVVQHAHLDRSPTLSTNPTFRLIK